MRKQFAVSLIVLLAVAGSAFAGTEARMSGKVVDAVTKEPIKDAVVALESTEKMTVKQSSKTKADGMYALFVLDGTIRYKFTVTAEGYDKFETLHKLSIGINETRDIQLNKAGTTPGASAAPAAPPKPDPATTAYNEGAALANAGDLPGAIAKFQEAVTAKPDLYAGWAALAKMQLRQKNYDKAIEAAGKVLEVDDTDVDSLTVQFQAYTAKGDKENAAKIEPKLPKNPSALFNDAARKINAGDDASAEKLLKQAIAADEKFAKAHYELGMVYVRAGKSADAKASLQKYLELEPNGADAPTAKEMMNYLK